MIVALLIVASIAGCNRSATLPPLVEEEDAPQIPGKFVWHHLVTGDAEAACAFYGALFGWEFDVKDGGRYSVITHEGHNLGGILDVSKDGKVPKAARWLSAMSVTDIDASLARVEKSLAKTRFLLVHGSRTFAVRTGDRTRAMRLIRGGSPDDPRITYASVRLASIAAPNEFVCDPLIG